MTSPPGYLVRIDTKGELGAVYSAYAFALDVTPAATTKGAERLMFVPATGRSHKVAARRMRRESLPKAYDPRRIARNIRRRAWQWKRTGTRYHSAAVDAVLKVLGHA